MRAVLGWLVVVLPAVGVGFVLGRDALPRPVRTPDPEVRFVTMPEVLAGRVTAVCPEFWLKPGGSREYVAEFRTGLGNRVVVPIDRKVVLTLNRQGREGLLLACNCDPPQKDCGDACKCGCRVEKPAAKKCNGCCADKVAPPPREIKR